MPLPAPNLDDRRFQDLVDDAKRLVQRRCPEWTDHNVSDPGVTLIETFAYLVDQVLFRLNRVPERSYVTFLDLMGVELFPPGAALVPVTFWLTAPLEEDRVVEAGTEVATRRRRTSRGAGVPHHRGPRHPALPADVRDDGQRRQPALRPVRRARQRAAGGCVLGRAAGGRRAVRGARSRRPALRGGDPRRVRARRATASTRPIRRGCGRRSAPTAGSAATSRTAPAGSTRPVTSSSTSPSRTSRRCSRSARVGGCAAGWWRLGTSTSRSTRRVRCCWPSTPRRSAGRRRRCTARTSSTSWSVSPRACRASASPCCRRPVVAAERPIQLEIAGRARLGAVEPGAGVRRERQPTTSTGGSTPTTARSCSDRPCASPTARSSSTARCRLRERTSACVATAPAAVAPATSPPTRSSR